MGWDWMGSEDRRKFKHGRLSKSKLILNVCVSCQVGKWWKMEWGIGLLVNDEIGKQLNVVCKAF
jgi:hypothetical protein